MQPQLLVVCKGDAQLVGLDPKSLAVRWRADLSAVGHEVVASRDGTLGLVPLYGTGGVGRPGRSGDGIDVVDLRNGTRRGTIPLPRASRPHFADWGRDGVLHVTAEGIGSVLSVDVPSWVQARAGVEIDPLRHGRMRTHHRQTHMLAVAPDGSRVYTSNVCPGTVSELEVASGAVRSLHLARRVNRISLSPDGTTAYVADQDEPRLAVVDVLTMTLDRWLALPDIAFGTAAVRAGCLVMAMRHTNQLALLETATGETLRSVVVPASPQRVVVSGDGRTVFATCSPSNRVVAVDVDAMRVVALGAPGRDPDGVAVSGPPRRRQPERDPRAPSSRT